MASFTFPWAFSRRGRISQFLASPPTIQIIPLPSKAFKAASGVGPKLAQRITLELKDKVGKGLAEGGIALSDVSTAAGAAGAASQAISALVTLGYSQSEAALAISKLDASLPVEELIRLALRGMAMGKR